MNIGTNLAAVTYWSTEEPFVDRFHTAGNWAARNSSGVDITSKLTFNSNGYVANQTGIYSLSVAVEMDPKAAAPTDEYVLTFDGTASKITINGATIVSQTADKVVFDYTGPDDKPDVYIGFSGLNASDPINNVHVVRADQVNLYNSGEIFNPDFVAKVAQWGVVRFMDWGNTNDSAAVNWTTRTTLTDGSWSRLTTTDGVPLEAMVKLANEAHVDMWYNVPTTANNTYVTNALTYIRDHLDPTLKVHVEWSNEVWNGGFAAHGYAQHLANNIFGGGSYVPYGANIYYGYRSAQIASIAHGVFGTQAAGRLVDVLSGQGANSTLMSYFLDGVAKAGLGSASSLFQDYAIAPYFGDELSQAGKNSADRAVVMGWVNSGSAGLDAAFHELEYGGSLSKDFSLAVIDTWLSKGAAAAQAAGLNLVTYEAGASLGSAYFPLADQPSVKAFFGELMNDPRMGDLYAKLVADFKAAGGTDFLAFNDVSSNSSSGYFGVLDSVYDSSSPRYEALLAAGQTVTSLATIGNDTLKATIQGGTIDGLAGNDVINAGSANDTIDGSDGNDTIVGSSSSTDARGALIEQDYYSGGAGSDTITGGVGNDHIYGNEVSSSASAPDGNDSLSGGGGMDQIRGGAGADTIEGGDGNDWIYGGDGDDVLTGGTGKDYMQGDLGNDLLSGGIGNDVVRGGGGDDTVQGNDGDDTLYGDTGYDRLTGGAGNDLFSFAAGQAPFTTTGTAAYKSDEIMDFTDGADKITLGFVPVEILQGGTAATLSAAANWAAQALQAHAGALDVAAVSVGTDTYLFYDDTGKGGALNASIHLDQVLASTFSVADFV